VSFSLWHEMEESIYNLIPRPAELISKPPMYRSKHNAKMPPSCSSFGLFGTTKLSANESGQAEHEAAVAKSDHATFGTEMLGSISPQEFLKRKSRTLPPMSAVPAFERPLVSPKRADVPKMAEKPVLGLVTEKNFIVANAVDNILAVPKRPRKAPALAIHSRSFGRLPRYLEKIRAEVQQEYTYLKEANM